MTKEFIEAGLSTLAILGVIAFFVWFFLGPDDDDDDRNDDDKWMDSQW